MTTLRQRSVLLIGAILAAFIWLQGIPAWTSAQGVAGASLLYAASPGQSIGLAIVLGAIVVIIAAATAALARVLHGVLALAVGLVFPAVRGGTIDEWLREAGSSQAYWLFVGESLLWALLIALAAVAIAAGARQLRPRLRWTRMTPQQEGHFWGFEPPLNAGVLAGSSSRSPLPPARRRRVNLLASTFVSTVIGATIAAMLVRSIEPWQVVWGIGIAFTVGSLLGHQMFPASNPLGLIVSPLIAAALWYGWAAITGGSSARMLHDYFGGSFTHAALALPIYYASAGVAGAAAGTLWSQAMFLSPQEGETK
jgi:hypothetical protein